MVSELDGPEPAQTSVPWRHLHPASAFINFIPQAWILLRQFWPVVLFVVLGRGGQNFNLIGMISDFAMASLFFGLAFLRSLVHQFSLRYRLIDGKLEIEHGVLQREHRVFSTDRVQGVEVVRNVFQRLAGLAEVRIETASGFEVEGLLSALDLDEATRVCDALRKKPSVQLDTPQVSEVLAHESLPELVLYGMTGMRIGAGLVFAFVLIEAFSGEDVATQVVEGSGGLVALLGGLLVLVLAQLVGTLTVVARYFGQTLFAPSQDMLVLEGGLFTRNRVELRRERVQLITWTQPWIHRLLGRGSLLVQTASAAKGAEGMARQSAVMPILPIDLGHALVPRLLPVASFDGLDRPLTPLVSQAMWREVSHGLWRRVLNLGLLAGAVVVFASFGGPGVGTDVWPWVLVLAVLAAALGALEGWLDGHSQGWLVSDAWIVVRRGWLVQTTQIVLRRRIQGVSCVQPPWLAWRGLGSVSLHVAGFRTVVMPNLPIEQARAMVIQLSGEVAKEASWGLVEAQG